MSTERWLERDVTAWLHVKSSERNGREFWGILEEGDEECASGHSRFALQPFKTDAKTLELSECV
jgi:hypothetical protein